MRKVARNVVDQLEEILIGSELLKQARELKLDVSRAAEDGIAKAVSAEKSRLWKIENQAALESSNEYVERHGLPLASYRPF